MIEIGWRTFHTSPPTACTHTSTRFRLASKTSSTMPADISVDGMGFDFSLRAVSSTVYSFAYVCGISISALVRTPCIARRYVLCGERPMQSNQNRLWLREAL